MSETKLNNVMKIDEYNAILNDFNKLTSYSRKSENELKKKYKHLPQTTLGSIISSLVQRSMKHSYRKYSTNIQ